MQTSQNKTFISLVQSAYLSKLKLNILLQVQDQSKINTGLSTLRNIWNVQLSFKFFFKNTIMSTFSGERLALCAVTMSPAVENTLSLGTDVAGLQVSIQPTWLHEETSSCCPSTKQVDLTPIHVIDVVCSLALSCRKLIQWVP